MLQMIEDPELRQLFKVESAEHLAGLDDGLLALEKNRTDQAILESVFREAHSLKGAARMLGLSKIESTAHGLESILNPARKGETPLLPDTLESMTQVLGHLRQLVQEALTGQAPKEPAYPAAPSNMPAAAAPVAAFVDETTTAELSLARPSQEPASTEKVVPTPDIAIAAEQNKTETGEPFRIETVRVETRKLDDLLTLAGELSVIQGRWQHRQSLLEEMSEQWSLLERNRRKFRSTLNKSDSMDKSSDAIRQRLDADNQLLARLGGLIKQTTDAFHEDGARLETTSNTLAERVHAARLVPLSALFSLFPRMVHDLAREYGKQVELLIEGGELNVDKRVLEEMKDPLMHLLRNAIDHGIEAPAERQQQNKPRNGTIRLRALRENNSVLLEIHDDGRAA